MLFHSFSQLPLRRRLGCQSAIIVYSPARNFLIHCCPIWLIGGTIANILSANLYSPVLVPCISSRTQPPSKTLFLSFCFPSFWKSFQITGRCLGFKRSSFSYADVPVRGKWDTYSSCNNFMVFLTILTFIVSCLGWLFDLLVCYKSSIGLMGLHWFVFVHCNL